MAKLFDLAYLKRNLNSDDEELLVLLNIFLETVPETLDQINSFLKKKEFIEISKLAHRLKTTIDLFCIKDIENDIRELEAIAKTGTNQNRVTDLTNTVVSTLRNVLIQIGEEKSRMEKSNDQVLH